MPLLSTRFHRLLASAPPLPVWSTGSLSPEASPLARPGVKVSIGARQLSRDELQAVPAPVVGVFAAPKMPCFLSTYRRKGYNTPQPWKQGHCPAAYAGNFHFSRRVCKIARRSLVSKTTTLRSTSRPGYFVLRRNFQSILGCILQMGDEYIMSPDTLEIEQDTRFQDAQG